MQIQKNITAVNRTVMKNRQIRYIVLHYTGNRNDTAAANCNYFKNINRSASAHYFVDATSIWQCVEEKDAAWAVGRNYGSGNLFGKCTNANSISIEMCSQNGAIPDATVSNAVELTRTLMDRYSIPADRVVRHWDVCSKLCPGWYGWIAKTGSEAYWLDFKRRIAAKKTEGESLDFSLVYDYAYYTSHHTDAGSGAAAFFHFLSDGMKNGQRASFWFDPWWYRGNYSDLRQAFGGDWSAYYQHWMQYGHEEGRFPLDLSAVFDLNFYRGRHADLSETFREETGQYVRHFMEYGMREGRQACAGFSPTAYRKKYSDLDAAFGDDWMSYYRHWIEFGKAEGREGV